MSHGDPDDIDLPVPEDGSSGVPEIHTVLELFEACEKTISEYQGRYLPQAIYNERMAEGEQFIDLNGDEIVNSEHPEWVPKASRNLLRNLRLTWSSRVLEDRPFVRAYPAEPGADQLKADLGQRYIQFLRQRIDFDDLCFRAAQLVQVHSCVGFKYVWDPLIGPEDPATGERLGDVSIEIVTIFDYGTDGAENVEDSKWVVFWKWIDPYDAREMLRAAGIEDDKLEVDKFKDIWGVEKEGVKVQELWWKPDMRFTSGLFAVKVGGAVIQAGPWPYERMRELPIAVWKCAPRRGSPYGSTHFDDAVNIQKVINDTVSAIHQQARMIGSVKLLASPALAEQYEHGNQILRAPGADELQFTRYLEPPNRAAVLVETLEDSERSIYEVYGLNEMLTGSENMKSGTSARSIAYINKLDSMKSAGATRSLGKAIRRMIRGALKLSQEWIVDERFGAIAGDQSGLGPLLYKGTDFDGLDVILEDASAIESYRATIAQTAKDQIAQTGPTPELTATSQTGLVDSAYTRSQIDIVGAQAKAILSGQEAQPSPEVDPEIAVAFLTQMLSAVPPGSPQQIAMVQLLTEYKEAAATKAQEMQQEQMLVDAAGGGKQDVPKQPGP